MRSNDGQPEPHVFPTNRVERTQLLVFTLCMLPIFAAGSAVFLTTPYPFPDLIAVAVLFIIQQVFLAFTVYFVFALIWCLVQPDWLQRRSSMLQARTMRTFLCFLIGCLILIVFIVIRRLMWGPPL